MSDGLDLMFERVRVQPPPAPFRSAEAVRRRGRQRAQHQAVAIAAAVLVVAGAGVGWAVNNRPVNEPTTPVPTNSTGSPRASESAGPSAGPVPTDLASLMLRAEDLGPGNWRQRAPYEPFEGDLWDWADLCPAYRTADYPSLRNQIAVDTTGYSVGQPESYLDEHVYRYAPGWGPRALDDVRRVLATCPGSAPPVPPGAAAPSRRAIIDTGFAGDEALMIREEQWSYQGETLAPTPRVQLITVVRVGDLVAVVILPSGRDESYARQVSASAAARLSPR